MFFLFPVIIGSSVTVLMIYVLAAVLPAAYLLRYIYVHDTIEKEPGGLLLKLLLGGVLAALASGILEGIAEGVLEWFVSPYSPLYTTLLAFVVVAVVEEGTKYFFLRRFSWRHPAFNYRFDGIVYAVFVSLGFAAFENIQYVFSYGLSVAVPRALLAVPGHMAFAVFMGAHYGRAKAEEAAGGSPGPSLLAGYLTAVFLHGFYDACAMSGSFLSTILFTVFVALMFLAAFRTIKRESSSDMPV